MAAFRCITNVRAGLVDSFGQSVRSRTGSVIEISDESIIAALLKAGAIERIHAGADMVPQGSETSATGAVADVAPQGSETAAPGAVADVVPQDSEASAPGAVADVAPQGSETSAPGAVADVVPQGSEAPAAQINPGTSDTPIRNKRPARREDK